MESVLLRSEIQHVSGSFFFFFGISLASGVVLYVRHSSTDLN
jgi:hypothetical protein